MKPKYTLFSIIAFAVGGCVSPGMVLTGAAVMTGAVNANLAAERREAGVAGPSFLQRVSGGIGELFGQTSPQECYDQLIASGAQLRASTPSGMTPSQFARQECAR